MQHKKRAIILIFLCALLLFACIPACAEDTRTLRVGCIDIENFLIIGHDGTVSGYGADYLDEISKYTGWEYEYVQGTWEQCMAWLEGGQIDLLFPAEPSPERNGKYLFSDISCCMDCIALLACWDNDTLYYEDYANYNGIRVGQIHGNFLNDAFDSYAEEHHFTYQSLYFQNYSELSKALEQHEVDAILMGNLNIGSNQKLLAKFDYMPAYFIMPKSHTALMAELNNALFQITLDNPQFTSNLMENYYGPSSRLAKSFTREEADYIRSADPLRVACASDYAPFEAFQSDTRTFHGIDIDLLTLIAEQSGLRLEYIPYPSIADSWEALRNGEADLVTGVYWDDTLGEHYHAVSAESRMKTTFFAVLKADASLPPDDSLSVALPSSLPGLAHYLAKCYPQWTVVPYDTAKACFHAVDIGETDMTFVNSLFLQTTPLLLRHPSLNTYTGITVSLPLSLVLSQDKPEILLSIINKSLAMISEEQFHALTLRNTSISHSTYSLSNILYYHPRLLLTALCIILAVSLLFLFLLIRFQMRKREARIMAEKNRQLEQANAAKFEFLSRMSHDMRTPMNAIIGLAELAEGKQSDPSAMASYLYKIKTSSKFLLGLINDILDMSRLESQTIELHPEVYSMNDFQEQINTIIRPVCDQKGVDFQIQADPNLALCIRVDKLRFNQIFFNLLSNAAKYTLPGGKIQLTICLREQADPLHQTMDITVRDSGIGISKDFQKHMFEPFSQENPVSANPQGTGLGLAITKNLLDLIGGTITVDSAPGKGTTVTVTMDVEIVPMDEIPEEQPILPDNHERLQGKHILLCEDNLLNTEITCNILAIAGVSVTCAENGKEGVELFCSSTPGTYDAILMDIQMPVMDGLQAAREIRTASHPDSRAIPIIAMTANAYAEDFRHSLDAGMNGHLAKPVDSRLLFSTLEQFL